MLSGQAWPGQHAGGGGATPWPSGAGGEESGAGPDSRWKRQGGVVFTDIW